VLTFASDHECVLYPPLFAADGFSYAVHLTPTDEPGRFTTDMRPRLQDALTDLLGRELTFIPCGGSERLHQTREQWTDGANVFALAPGVVVGYERNRRTFDELRRHGYRVVSAESFLDYHAHSTFAPGSEKLALQLAGTELSRGRGGPRCMTLPLVRASSPTTPHE
jgi:arginine deiminase